MTTLTVERHSGRANGAWRVLYNGTDSAKAHAVYERESIALRQGSVRKLVDGIVASSTGAPNLRTRW